MQPFKTTAVSYTHLAKGVEEMGLIGAFTGGIRATAGGVAAAIFFGYLNAVLFDPHGK